MSDLRESGSIENDSDTVLFVHPEPVSPEGKKRLGEVDIVVRKQRSGVSDVDIALAWQPHKARIKQLGW
jgi:replicative DNA helicase